MDFSPKKFAEYLYFEVWEGIFNPSTILTQEGIMKLKTVMSMLMAAAMTFSLTAADTAAKDAAAQPQAVKKAKAKKAKARKVAMPADGGLKAATTAQARQNPNAAKKTGWHKHWDNKRKQLAKQKNDIQIVFIGDSITHFWNRKPNPDGPKPRLYGGDATYNKYFSNYRLLNLGYSGDRTNHTLWMVNQSGFMDNIKPKLVVVMIGTNNFGGRNPMADAPATAAAIKLIVESILAKQPDTKVLLFGIFPRGAKAKNGFRTKIKQTNDIICKLANDKNVFYCDITDKLLEKDGSLSAEVMPDYLHPADKGYEVWAQAIMPYVKRFVD